MEIQGESGLKHVFLDMETEKTEEEDAAPQPYVASYNFIASGGDQVREADTDDRSHNR